MEVKYVVVYFVIFIECIVMIHIGANEYDQKKVQFSANTL